MRSRLTVYRQIGEATSHVVLGPHLAVMVGNAHFMASPIASDRVDCGQKTIPGVGFSYREFAEHQVRTPVERMETVFHVIADRTTPSRRGQISLTDVAVGQFGKSFGNHRLDRIYVDGVVID